MQRADFFRKMEEIIAMEDSFVENITSMDLTNVQHSHFTVTTFLKMKSGLTKLLDDSRRHKEILTHMMRIIAGDPRDEY